MSILKKITDEFKLRWDYIKIQEGNSNFIPYNRSEAILSIAKSSNYLDFFEEQSHLSMLNLFLNERLSCNTLMYLNGLIYTGNDIVDVKFVRPNTKIKMPTKNPTKWLLYAVTGEDMLLSINDVNRADIASCAQIEQLLMERFPLYEIEQLDLKRWAIIDINELDKTFDFNLYNVYI